MSNKQLESVIFGEEDSPQSEERSDYIAILKKIGVLEALWMQSNATDALIDRLRTIGDELQKICSRLHFAEERINFLISKEK